MDLASLQGLEGRGGGVRGGGETDLEDVVPSGAEVREAETGVIITLRTEK